MHPDTGNELQDFLNEVASFTGDAPKGQLEESRARDMLVRGSGHQSASSEREATHGRDPESLGVSGNGDLCQDSGVLTGESGSSDGKPEEPEAGAIENVAQGVIEMELARGRVAEVTIRRGDSAQSLAEAFTRE